MSFALYYHPLSSFCWKVLIALYEADLTFEPRQVNLGDAAERAAFEAVWPLAKFPVLRDHAANKTIPESSVIVEYLARTQLSAACLFLPIPTRPCRRASSTALSTITSTFRFSGSWRRACVRRAAHDPFGVEQARGQIRSGYELVGPMIAGPWAMGEAFTMADCAALPALFYADFAVALGDWPELAAYLDRLKTRPSVARVLAEAEPFFQYFPLRNG